MDAGSHALAAEAAPIAVAAGPYVAPLMGAVEDLLTEVAAATAPALAPHGASTIAAGGKRLRPLLVLVAAGGAPDDPAGLVRAAASVELVHSATLVHDDVLDGADLRRGQPTVVATAGPGMATAAGDQLFARAFTLLVANGRPDEVRVLSDAGSALARGELLQREDAWNAEVTLDRYLLRCELKTARLFESACTLGVMESPATATDPRMLAPFGRDVGLAFQILDDVLDVQGPAERTGKHRGTDLLDGTVTLPFILARERDPALRAIEPRTITSAEQAEQVCDAIASTGALAEAREQALALVERARASLPDGLGRAQREALELVAHGVVARYA
ncbi:polyprenyl synthetase family protein [Paraconexibacter sp.]|uniref:polyprenyl synthetase family protein n=1 Tax=Paraconexibacter sp. TaxID=2949640 RepID=UPI0035682A1C